MTLSDKIALAALLVAVVGAAGTWIIVPGVQPWLKRHWKDLLIIVLLLALIYKFWECWPKNNPVPPPAPPPPPPWVNQDSISCAHGNDNRGEFYLTDPDPTEQINQDILPCGHTVKAGSNSSVQLYVGTAKVNYGKITTHSKDYLGGTVRPIGFTLRIDPTPPHGQEMWQLSGGTPDNCKNHVGMVSSSQGQLACVNDSIGYLAPLK